MLSRGRPLVPREPVSGIAIRRAREGRRMSRAMIARRLSDMTGARVHAHNVKAWESCTARPPSFIVDALCRIFGATRSLLLAPTARCAP